MHSLNDLKKQAAEATVTEINTTTPTTTEAATVTDHPRKKKRVLLLGAGRVAAPALHLLLTCVVLLFTIYVCMCVGGCFVHD